MQCHSFTLVSACSTPPRLHRVRCCRAFLDSIDTKILHRRAVIRACDFDGWGCSHLPSPIPSITNVTRCRTLPGALCRATFFTCAKLHDVKRRSVASCSQHGGLRKQNACRKCVAGHLRHHGPGNVDSSAARGFFTAAAS